MAAYTGQGFEFAEQVDLVGALCRQDLFGQSVLHEDGPSGWLADDVDLAHNLGLGEFDKRGVVDCGGGHGDLRGGALQVISA